MRQQWEYQTLSLIGRLHMVLFVVRASRRCSMNTAVRDGNWWPSRLRPLYSGRILGKVCFFADRKRLANPNDAPDIRTRALPESGSLSRSIGGGMSS